MKIRLFFLVFLLWSLTIGHSYGQLIADFPFDDTSDLPSSLKKNTVGPDAISINPYASSDGEGIYMLADPNTAEGYANVELEIDESLINYTESIYMEWDFRCQEGFAWLIFSGFNLFRFGHANYPDDPGQQGLHVRYSTKANPDVMISSGYVGEPLARGERSLIGFLYDAESGTAYIYKNGKEIWRTPEAERTPGYGMHWQTAEGSFVVGANMNGEGSTIPSLYHFRIFESVCSAVLPPNTKADTICPSSQATLRASGGEEGQYRWYKSEGEAIIPIEGEVSSTYLTENLQQSETFYVSLATQDCESPLVPVKANVVDWPAPPIASYEAPCGPGETNIFINDPQDGLSYRWFADPNANPLEENDTLSVFISRDTVLYVSASNGICESALVPVEVQLKELPLIDAGPDLTILKGESIDLQASGSYASCSWLPHQSLQFPDSPTPKVQPSATQSYVVRALSADGCEESDTVTVFVVEKFPVPNAFSPNQDGLNDTWEIPNIENYPNCKLVVFNKWGNEVFRSKGYTTPWDGTHNGSQLPFDTYYYRLQLNDTQNISSGTVTIIR